MAQTVSQTSAAACMRRRSEQYRAAGWKRNSYWVKPDAIRILDEVRDKMGLDSREAAINAILERIGDDMFLRQEFLTVTT